MGTSNEGRGSDWKIQCCFVDTSDWYSAVSVSCSFSMGFHGLLTSFLSSNQASIETAIVYMHRFYIFHPVKMFPCEVTAPASFSVGAKSRLTSRDSERSLVQIVKATLRALKQEQPERCVIEEFLQEISEVELGLSLTLGYEYAVELPSHYIKMICKSCDIGEKSNEFIAIQRVALHR